MNNRHLRKKVSMMVDSATIETYQTKVEEGNDNPRSINWKLFNQFGTSKKGNTKVNSFEIKMNNRIISDDLDITKLCSKGTATLITSMFYQKELYKP